MTNGQQPAFPLATEELSDRFSEGVILSVGLTKREYFAAAALQGLLANSYGDSNSPPTLSCATQQEMAAMARDQADHLINALEAI